MALSRCSSGNKPKDCNPNLLKSYPWRLNVNINAYNSGTSVYGFKKVKLSADTSSTATIGFYDEIGTRIGTIITKTVPTASWTEVDIPSGAYMMGIQTSYSGTMPYFYALLS